MVNHTGMKLEKYILQTGQTQTAFASKIGVSPVTIGRYLRSERRPTWEVMSLIIKETGGKVTYEDFA